MTIVNYKTLKWLLGGTVFFLTLVACGCTKPRPAAELFNGEPAFVGDSEEAMSAPSPRHGELATAADAPPPSVNIFGELNGASVQSPRPGGDANLQQHTFLEEGFDSDVAADPSGKWIVFASTRHSERANIYLQRTDGLSVTQLTSADADHAFPVFSPDGRQIAFCSTRGGNWDIYTMDVDGKNVVQVTSGPSQDVRPSFSPDGTRLVYSSLSSRNNQWELWIVNLPTLEKRMIGYGLFPNWSPNKQTDRIAFQRSRQRGSRWFSLWTLELVNGEARRVTEVAASSNAAILSPSWSPDGKKIAFATIVDPGKNSPGKVRSQQDVWVIDADGGNRHRLTDGNATNLTPFWAVDNRVYFVSDRGGSECVWSMRADAGGTQTAGLTEDKPVASGKPNGKVAGDGAAAVGSTDSRELGH